MCLIGGYWNYKFSKIEIVMSDILNYEIIKLYFCNGTLAEELKIKSGKGVNFVYNNILKYQDMKPKVVLIDIKVKVITHVLET